MEEAARGQGGRGGAHGHETHPGHLPLAALVPQHLEESEGVDGAVAVRQEVVLLHLVLLVDSSQGLQVLRVVNRHNKINKHKKEAWQIAAFILFVYSGHAWTTY